VSLNVEQSRLIRWSAFICSVCEFAEALGCPVVIVGRPGVGDAVDSFNLNAAFFRVRQGANLQLTRL
jgi:hypothetical protein